MNIKLINIIGVDSKICTITSDLRQEHLPPICRRLLATGGGFIRDTLTNLQIRIGDSRDLQ